MAIARQFSTSSCAGPPRLQDLPLCTAIEQSEFVALFKGNHRIGASWGRRRGPKGPAACRRDRSQARLSIKPCPGGTLLRGSGTRVVFQRYAESPLRATRRRMRRCWRRYCWRRYCWRRYWVLDDGSARPRRRFSLDAAFFNRFASLVG
jgi:hypothetical protein